MKKLLAVTLLVVLLCFFAGCTSFWYQEGKTFAECAQNLRNCRSDMKKYSDKSLNLGLYDLRFEKDCMEGKGYRLVKESQLPLRVRRQGPDTRLDEKYGVAGILEY